MAKQKSFEEKLENSKAILEKLMNPNITLSDSVKAYEEGVKELQEAQAILENAKLQIETMKRGEG